MANPGFCGNATSMLVSASGAMRTSKARTPDRCPPSSFVAFAAGTSSRASDRMTSPLLNSATPASAGRESAINPSLPLIRTAEPSSGHRPDRRESALPPRRIDLQRTNRQSNARRTFPGREIPDGVPHTRHRVGGRARSHRFNGEPQVRKLPANRRDGHPSAVETLPYVRCVHRGAQHAVDLDIRHEGPAAVTRLEVSILIQQAFHRATREARPPSSTPAAREAIRDRAPAAPSSPRTDTRRKAKAILSRPERDVSDRNRAVASARPQHQPDESRTRASGT